MQAPTAIEYILLGHAFQLVHTTNYLVLNSHTGSSCSVAGRARQGSKPFLGFHVARGNVILGTVCHLDSMPFLNSRTLTIHSTGIEHSCLSMT